MLPIIKSAIDVPKSLPGSPRSVTDNVRRDERTSEDSHPAFPEGNVVQSTHTCCSQCAHRSTTWHQDINQRTRMPNQKSQQVHFCLKKVLRHNTFFGLQLFDIPCCRKKTSTKPQVRVLGLAQPNAKRPTQRNVISENCHALAESSCDNGITSRKRWGKTGLQGRNSSGAVSAIFVFTAPGCTATASKPPDTGWQCARSASPAPVY